MAAAQIPAPELASASRSKTPTRTSAPYGQACINCVKAKCKCILTCDPASSSASDNHVVCERCARLGRECKPSSSIRKRGGAVSRRETRSSASSTVPKSTSAATRAANLEQKLEDLVAVLKAQTNSTFTHGAIQQDAGGPQRQGTVDQVARGDAGLSTSSAPWRSNNTSSRAVAGGPTVVTPASTVESVPSPLPTSIPGELMPAPQAEETLAFFRQNYLLFFPFVYLPPDMTAARLQRERPYLWLNIRALCTRSPIEQAALNRQSREELARSLIVSFDSNIDMVLGIVCYLGWIMHLSFKPGTVTTISMATTLITVHRLDKPIHEEDPRIMHCFKTPDFKKLNHSTIRTMEERRVALACYVGCITGSSLMKCPAMRWTPHMEDNLKILAANPEWEGDKILVLMVRVWRLAENIMQTQSTWASDHDSHGNSKPPIKFYIKYFRQSLEKIKNELPASLKNNRLAKSLIMQIDLQIAEISLSSWCHSEAHADTTTETPEIPHPIDISRVEANWAAMQASKEFFEHFLTFELSDFVGFSFPVLLNFYRAAGLLYRLRVTDDPGWDGCVVTESVDLVSALNMLSDRHSQLLSVYGFLTETDAEGNELNHFFAKSMRTFSTTATMWQAHFAQADASRKGGTTEASDVCGASAGCVNEAEAHVHHPPGVSLNANIPGRTNYQGMPNFMMPDVFPMDFSMDDAWCNEIMSSWEPGLPGPY
ncbi:hypothetical protein F5Y08DRAFT_309511 [Xylaria arbuscula]|nr:hypothetical protein F5Y08DRAFT_309511 [Xylaria arbuscula]